MTSLSLSLLAALAVLGPPAEAPEGPREQSDESADETVEGAVELPPVERDGNYLIVDAEPPSAFDEPRPAPVEFRAGVTTMTRAEFTRTRSVDGVGESTTALPVRLRGRLEARTEHMRLRADLQDARTLSDPLGAPRSGFHQLFAEYVEGLPAGELSFRAGRQEFERGTFHLFGIAPWGPGMRSWDGIRLSFAAERGGVEVFGGSLARPLLSSGVSLIEHVRDPIALSGVVAGHYKIVPALEIEATVWASYRKTTADTRNIVTTGLRLHGELAPGLGYDADGHLQLGTIDRLDLRQQHVAGSAYATLAYLSPRELGPARAQPGAFLLFDFASGSKCTTTEYTGLAPCTEGVNHDFDSPWMRRHRWFGHADRFRAQNVIDANAGVRVLTEPVHALDLRIALVNHVFAFPQPGGRWHAAGGAPIGVDLDNRNPWAADEIDLEAGLRYGWLSVSVGWLVVADLGGGQAISGERLRQLVYAMLTIDAWSPWR